MFGKNLWIFFIISFLTFINNYKWSSNIRSIKKNKPSKIDPKYWETFWPAWNILTTILSSSVLRDCRKYFDHDTKCLKTWNSNYFRKLKHGVKYYMLHPLKPLVFIRLYLGYQMKWHYIDDNRECGPYSHALPITSNFFFCIYK